MIRGTVRDENFEILVVSGGAALIFEEATGITHSASLAITWGSLDKLRVLAQSNGLFGEVVVGVIPRNKSTGVSLP